jgi:hypothetical protein
MTRKLRVTIPRHPTILLGLLGFSASFCAHTKKEKPKNKYSAKVEFKILILTPSITQST